MSDGLLIMEDTLAVDLNDLILGDSFEERVASSSSILSASENSSLSSPDEVLNDLPNLIANFLDECSFVLPHLEPTVIQSFVLSKWDHILGPRAVHVWMLDSTEEPVMVGDVPLPSRSSVIDAVHYVVDHSLNASDAGETVHGNKSALYVVPRDNLVSFAVCFRVGDRRGANHVAYSLSVIVESKWLQFVCDIQPILQTALQIQAAKLRVYFTRDVPSDSTSQDWISATSVCLVDMCVMLSALQSNPLDKFIPITSSLGEDNESGSGNVMNLMADKRFFERALTGHLQTGGRSLVLGSNEKVVASMLGILSLFLTREERVASSGPTGSRKYFPLLHMQGYLVDLVGINYITAASLMESPSPITIIDMNKSQVRQTALKHHHAKLHHLSVKNTLMSLRDPQLRMPQFSETILHQVREESPLVIGLVKEILKVPPALWEYVIGLFMRELNWRAYALIQIVEDETNWIAQDIDVGSAKQPMHKYLQSLVTGVSPSTPQEADFLIILAMADKLSPGIFNYVMNKKIPL
ncbi:unnamed protein product [Notodromas monacha]|uniref:Uncharacterized protein n=1 Tax=Notodromas monacha TaxID=399045 RepID=A0A7R9GCH3_9CRUS|nr:unnamed protein product [Notodromas monacha]CAG0915842.1 unnamed protein product [Notodromas monacha]